MYPIAAQRDSPRRSLDLITAVAHSKFVIDAKSIPRFSRVSRRFASSHSNSKVKVYTYGVYMSAHGVHIPR